MLKRFSSAFTLIELLVVISIIGILIALSVFGLQGARESARDARRKADLELIRSGLEIYKSDCGSYPTTGHFNPNYAPYIDPDGKLTGDGSSTSCATTNVYISSTPEDPLWDKRRYSYVRKSADPYHYTICAALEQLPVSETPPDLNCGGCGIEGKSCNYVVKNP